MNEMLIETLKFTGSYFALAIVFFGVLHFLSKGWISRFILVRIGRSKKVLVNLHTLTGRVAKVGKYRGSDAIQYKGSDGKKSTISGLSEGDLYSYMGVWCVDYDEQRQIVIKPSGVYKSDIDPAKTDSLIDRALYAPQVDDNKEKLRWILMIAAAAAAIFAAYMAYKNGEAIAAIQSIQGVV